MTAKYQALDIANYILWYVNSNDSFPKNVSALKLQKLLYYVAATYLAENNNSLFNESIEKWKYGPVVPSVYQSFRSSGYHHISKPASRFTITDDLSIKEEGFDHNVIDVNPLVSIHIKKIVDKLIGYSSFELVDKTHKEPMWFNYSAEILSGVRNITYSNEELIDYFTSQPI